MQKNQVQKLEWKQTDMIDDFTFATNVVSSDCWHWLACLCSLVFSLTSCTCVVFVSIYYAMETLFWFCGFGESF